MSTFLTLRVLHILLATFLVGASVATTLFFAPAIKDARGAGGVVMAGIAKRGFMIFMSSVSGLTTLTGIYLYYHFTSGFDPVISGSMPGRVFGTGGLAGILVTIIGGAVIGRNAKKVVALMEKAGPLPDGPEKNLLLQQAAQCQRTMATYGKVSLVLMVIAVVCMSVGHYIG